MLTSPYKNIIQYATIKLRSEDLNTEIRNNMLSILKSNMEKRCNKSGFVDEIFKIVNYNPCEIAPENLSGSTNVEVDYLCRLCLPIEGTIIIAQVQIIEIEIIVLTNGPITIFVPKSEISNNWDVDISTYTHKKSNNILKIGDFVKINIVKKRHNINDTQIKIIGSLEDLATDKEVKEYYDVSMDKEESNSVI